MPVLLQPAGARARQGRVADRRLAARSRRSGRSRRAATASFRRRADGADGSRSPGCARGAGGALYQSHHLGRGAERSAALRPARRGPRARADIAAGRGRRQRRPPRALRRRARQEASAGRGRAQRGPRAHPQRAAASPQRHAHGRVHRSRRRHGRAAARDGARAVLRLGPGQSRRADADPRANG